MISNSRIPSHALRALFVSFILSLGFWPGGPAQADCGGQSSSSQPTNAGTEFLLCFEQNIDNSPTVDNATGGYLEIYLATLDYAATITVTSNRYPALNKTFFLQAHSSQIYRISDSVLQEGGGVSEMMNDLWITSDEVADNRVVMVQSTASIVCYGLDYKWESADAFCALPINSAGTDYRVMSYPNSINPNEGADMPSQFAVAAFQDNTTVTITPAAPTLGGHPAGTPFTVTLNKGQCVQVQTDASIQGLDLTGSMVSADNHIVVYGSHSRTEAPNGFRFPIDGLASRDMLLESMPPTSDWGSNFVLDAIGTGVGTFNPNGDVVRVLALHPNTTVTVNGQTWVTLNSNGFRDTVIHGPMMIQSSAPLLVGEIAHTDATDRGGVGDPFLAIVPPVDQTFNNYTFFLPSNTGNFNYQFVIIATDTASQGSISVDGTLLLPSLFTPVPGAVGNRGFSVLEWSLPSGVHTISTSKPAQNGFTILGYGLGNVVSYGYTAGSLLVPKRTIAIQYPPGAIGGQHTNALDFRNTSYETAYLDSAVFVPDDPKRSDFGIHVQENVAYDIGRLAVGAGARIHLVPTTPLDLPVSGTVKIYAHLPDYCYYAPIEDAEMPFTLYPDASDAVGTPDGLRLTVTAAPNPFADFTTINFSVPESGDITMTLYDELGRVVQHVTSGEFSPGAYSIRIERRGLPDGFYTCVIYSQKMNIDERVPIVAGR
ncbi:MAG TPA: hypothetical protein VFH95_12375 [Candidatus Kapabacteria bacterium]|nr:hypothetical protein [Candidatus Kapabacteria bacterium]